MYLLRFFKDFRHVLDFSLKNKSVGTNVLWIILPYEYFNIKYIQYWQESKISVWNNFFLVISVSVSPFLANASRSMYSCPNYCILFWLAWKNNFILIFLIVNKKTTRCIWNSNKYFQINSEIYYHGYGNEQGS